MRLFLLLLLLVGLLSVAAGHRFRPHMLGGGGGGGRAPWLPGIPGRGWRGGRPGAFLPRHISPYSPLEGAKQGPPSVKPRDIDNLFYEKLGSHVLTNVGNTETTINIDLGGGSPDKTGALNSILGDPPTRSRSAAAAPRQEPEVKETGNKSDRLNNDWMKHLFRSRQNAGKREQNKRMRVADFLLERRLAEIVETTPGRDDDVAQAIGDVPAESPAISDDSDDLDDVPAEIRLEIEEPEPEEMTYPDDDDVISGEDLEFGTDEFIASDLQSAEGELPLGDSKLDLDSFGVYSEEGEKHPTRSKVSRRERKFGGKHKRRGRRSTRRWSSSMYVPNPPSEASARWRPTDSWRPQVETQNVAGTVQVYPEYVPAPLENKVQMYREYAPIQKEVHTYPEYALVPQVENVADKGEERIVYSAPPSFPSPPSPPGHAQWARHTPHPWSRPPAPEAKSLPAPSYHDNHRELTTHHNRYRHPGQQEQQPSHPHHHGDGVMHDHYHSQSDHEHDHHGNGGHAHYHHHGDGVMHSHYHDNGHHDNGPDYNRHRPDNSIYGDLNQENRYFRAKSPDYSAHVHEPEEPVYSFDVGQYSPSSSPAERKLPYYEVIIAPPRQYRSPSHPQGAPPPVLHWSVHQPPQPTQPAYPHSQGPEPRATYSPPHQAPQWSGHQDPPPVYHHNQIEGKESGPHPPPPGPHPPPPGPHFYPPQLQRLQQYPGFQNQMKYIYHHDDREQRHQAALPVWGKPMEGIWGKDRGHANVKGYPRW